MIKFRAWVKPGVLSNHLDGVIAEAKPDFLGMNCLVKRNDLAGNECFDEIFDFDDVVLMQYTGLYDVNGKQYCQDDLVKWNGNIYRLIHGTYAFELYGFYYQMQDDPWDYFSEGAYLEGEIIGNIYANPELLSSEIK
ncbi:YopX family protein [Enterococcus asini]|uniref:YopX family protein n=1 Tax=Enterococcus asini TaxID=57732 RepID=UPI00241C67CD|nr:YopX family protein [Enterococcus asini]